MELPEGLELVRTDEGLVLTDGELALRQDFTEMLPRLRQDRLARELLVRAARVKGLPADMRPMCVDATAGLGEDSLLLAAAGAEVLLCESDPVICTLLRDALERAAEDVRLAPIVARMRVHEGDSIAVMRALAAPPHVVYLDPMFPARRKSAAVKKKFQLLHRLEAPCSNEAELLQAAIDTGAVKIVVKRPVKAPALAGTRPSHTLAGKAVRFDVVVPPRG